MTEEKRDPNAKAEVGRGEAQNLVLSDNIMDLSRFRAAPLARLSHLSFESDRAFPAQC